MQPLVSLKELKTVLKLPWSIRQLRRMVDDGIFKPIRVNDKCAMYFRPEQIEDALNKMMEQHQPAARREEK